MTPQDAKRRASRAPLGIDGGRRAFDEAIRMVRSNLEVALAEAEHPIVLVTSANPEEGKTVICSSLAQSFADAGRRVVLVDLDLRRPGAHNMIGAHNEYGVAEVLLGARTLKESLQYIEMRSDATGKKGLYFLATGREVSNPAELLTTARTFRMLESLTAQSDIVLLDAPPVLPVADTLVIGRIASGALLITEARRTARTATEKAKDLLIRNQTRILGAVLNKFQNRDAIYGSEYAYAYAYGRLPAEAAMQSGEVSDGATANGSPPAHSNN